MISPSSDKTKKEQEGDFSTFIKNKSNKRKKKASSLLKSKKVFLFIKNHAIHTKYETQLKSFGAVISPFLDKEINYVLTDIPGYNGKSPVVTETINLLSPTCYSVSPATSISGDDCTVKKSRTRAEAMLERVPVQAQNTSVSPITNAISWNIPVYSVDVFQNWLDKKLSQVQLINDCPVTKQNSNIKIFEKRYLKLESIVKNKHRPEFKEVSKWPSIDTNTLAGSCPFDKKSLKRSERKEKNHADKKKETDRMNRICNKITNEAGYCEICAVHYRDLTQHVTENTHLKFVCNDKNYADLDSCIKTRSVEAFLSAHNSSSGISESKEINTEEMGRNLRKSVSLHLNNNNENSAVTRALSNVKLLDESLKQPLQVQCNGFTNYHLRKSTIKSDSVLLKSTSCFDGKDLLRESRKIYTSCSEGNNIPQLSPNEDETLHRLRSRKNLILPSILLGTTAEDINKNRNIALSPQNASSNHFLRSSVSPKSQSVCHYTTRSKLPNSVEDMCKKTLYSPTQQKDLRITLGSSLHFTRSKLNNIFSSNEVDKKCTRGSFSPKYDERRPFKHKGSTIGVSDEDERRDGLKRASVSPRNVPSYQSNNKKPKINMCNEATLVEQNNIERAHKKRLSAEEKFLEDNKEYYKVEMLRTKLRSTEFYCNREISQKSTKNEDIQQPRSSLSFNMETTTKPIISSSNATSDSNESVVVRLKKVTKRNSALHLLNLEAENFMFGPSKNPKEEDEDDAKSEVNEDESKTDNTTNQINVDVLNEEKEIRNNEDNSSLNKQNARKTKVKKRRTHAEVFIHDNLDYYKFEISGSRLRHHSDNADVVIKSEPFENKVNSCLLSNENSVSSTLSTSNIKSHELNRIKDETTDDECESTQPVAPLRKVGRKRGKPQKCIKEISSANEIKRESDEMDKELTALKDEPQDIPECSSTANNTCCSRPPPPESITFSFESIPCAESWYRVFQRFDTCNEQYVNIPDNLYFNRYREMRRFDGPTSKVNKVEKQSPAKESNLVAAHFRRKRRQKLPRLILEDKPRKSPRCHASTLAILSSLTGHRRRSRKLHALEYKRSSSVRNVVAKSDLENKFSNAEFGHEYQIRLKEAVNIIAKDIDDHFIEIFEQEDCADRYLSTIKSEKLPSTTSDVFDVIKNEQPNTTENNVCNSVENERLPCCMQIDEEILTDENLLKCLAVESEFIGDMTTFLENSLKCNSMEAALDEEWMLPRSQHETLSRLCREYDYSCNSSDCGASSTYEFLGFAEDGRTVSRKRKRKRPNLTGWPHERNKRRQIRFLDRNHSCDEAGIETPMIPQSVSISHDNEGNNDAVSEADSEYTDDDIPLTEMVNRKKRCTNSTAVTDDDSKNAPILFSKDSTNSLDSNNRISLRRSSKNANGLSSASLSCIKKLSNSRRMSKFSSVSYSRRNR